MTGYDILMGILDERKAETLLDDLRKADRQAADLLIDCLSKLSDAFNIPSGQQVALARMRTLVRDGQRWDPALIRNNVFKIANSLGIRLPSAMFASQKEASELEQEWGPVLKQAAGENT